MLYILSIGVPLILDSSKGSENQNMKNIIRINTIYLSLITLFSLSPAPQECLLFALYFGKTQSETQKTTYMNFMIMNNTRIPFYQVYYIGREFFLVANIRSTTQTSLKRWNLLSYVRMSRYLSRGRLVQASFPVQTVLSLLPPISLLSSFLSPLSFSVIGSTFFLLVLF